MLGAVSCQVNANRVPRARIKPYRTPRVIPIALGTSPPNLFTDFFGGGQINNPGRSLVLLPPINGATAASGTPYFTENPEDPFKAWDASATFDYA